jgi:shikimate kinase/3-dehydroquinate synthase
MGHQLTGRGATVFIGFMGAGKSSAARELAAVAGGAALDTDSLIERRLGHTIAEEFDRNGEAGFRRLEEEIVCEVLDSAGPDDVIALGGGSVLSERVRSALEGHVVALIDVDLDTAWERATRRPRPLARDRAAFDALHAERQTIYEQLANAILPIGGKDLDPGLLAAVDRLRQAPPDTSLVWARSASGDYPVYVGHDLLGADLWPQARPASRRFCVTDEHVEPLYASRLGELDGIVTIAAGETSKTLATAERVLRELAGRGMTRDDHLAALGGGVVGDLAGFCAASYQRGVPVVQVPTTLVAQVDSAFGGKTGVDLPEAKNYVGAYHQPSAVVVDVETLATLPREERSAGYAEVLKTALIAGGELWRRVAAGDPPDEAMIIGCIRLKLAVVAEDERDAGRRQVLNLGHTVGHAIEAATGYARYRHGEAVGLGLLAALRLSGQGALRDQVRGLLVANGLPTTLGDVDPQSILAAVTRDKKRTAGSVPFVLLDAPGEVRTGRQVGEAELVAAVEELLA